MELQYPRWERQTINTNNSYPKGISGSEKFSPVNVIISQELLSMLTSIFDHTPMVRLQLFGVKKNETAPKEVQFGVISGTHNPQKLAPSVNFYIDRVEKVKYTTLVSYAIVLHKIDGNTRFYIASSKKSPKPTSPAAEDAMEVSATTPSSSAKQPTPYTFKILMESPTSSNPPPNPPEILMSMQNGGNSYRNYTENKILDYNPETIRINPERNFDYYTAICIKCTQVTQNTKALVQHPATQQAAKIFLGEDPYHVHYQSVVHVSFVIEESYHDLVLPPIQLPALDRDNMPLSPGSTYYHARDGYPRGDSYPRDSYPRESYASRDIPARERERERERGGDRERERGDREREREGGHATREREMPIRESHSSRDVPRESNSLSLTFNHSHSHRYS